MRDLIAVAEVAVRVLNEHRDLPPVSLAVLGASSVMLNLDAPHRLRLLAVARWAQALGTTVVVTPCDEFFELAARTSVDVAGCGVVEIVVLAYLDPCGLVMLTSGLGLAVNPDGSSVEVSPQRVLDALDARPMTEPVA